MLKYSISDLIYVSSNFNLDFITFPFKKEFESTNKDIDNLDYKKYIVFRNDNQIVVYSLSTNVCKIYNVESNIKQYLIVKDILVILISGNVLLISLLLDRYDTIITGYVSLLPYSDYIYNNEHSFRTKISDESFTLNIRKKKIISRFCYNSEHKTSCYGINNAFMLYNNKKSKKYYTDSSIVNILSLSLDEFVIITETDNVYVINIKNNTFSIYNNIHCFIMYLESLYNEINNSIILG